MRGSDTRIATLLTAGVVDFTAVLRISVPLFLRYFFLKTLFLGKGLQEVANPFIYCCRNYTTIVM